MSLSTYSLSKSWENAEDFSTYEDSEEQVRADMQYLFTELLNDINNLVSLIKAENVPFTPTTAVNANNLKDAIAILHEQIEGVSVGTLPDGSITNEKIADADTSAGSNNGIETAKIKNGAVTTDKLAAGAVATAKLADGAVNSSKIASQGVENSNIKDATIMAAKIAEGQVAKLDQYGKVSADALSSYVIEVTASKTLAATDAGRLLRVNSASDITITIPATASVSLGAGFEVDIVNVGTGAVTISASTVSLCAAGYADPINSIGVSKYQWIHLKKTNLSGDKWLMEGAGLLPAGSVGTSEIADGAVTSGKLATVPVTKGGTNATTAADALTNLGAASATDLSSHTGNTSNPHSVTAAQVGAVPTTRTVNSKALSADITLSASDVSAVPTTRTVNSKALSANITLSASDVSAVPTTRKVNNKALSADITLSAADVSARASNWNPALTDCSGTLAIGHGGTGATTAANARTGLGVTAEGKLKVGSTEYTLRTGTSGSSGYITFVT